MCAPQIEMNPCFEYGITVSIWERTLTFSVDEVTVQTVKKTAERLGTPQRPSVRLHVLRARRGRALSPSPSIYLQKGQQPPLAATFVAAVAVDANSATTTAVSPRSVVFIPLSLSKASLSRQSEQRKGCSRLESQALDLQAGLKVSN